MHYETACDRICEDVSRALLELRPPTKGAAYAAALATRTIAAAMHNASGRPYDPLWSHAIASLERFVDVCARRTTGDASAALVELRGFLRENADLLSPQLESRRAS